MAKIVLPLPFQTALRNSETYPRNNILKTVNTLDNPLLAIENRLDSIDSNLFENDKSEWEIPIRDLSTEDGKFVDKINAHTHERLTQWLGIGDRKGATVECTKKDPKCRFICIYGRHSRASLKLTRAMLSDIMTFHQVMPDFLDFLSLFGQQSDPNDLKFSGFREQAILNNPPDGMAIKGLGRSGSHYQLCYNLKCVALKSEDKENFMLNEWSIRQTAIHHQFDVLNGNTLWIVAKGNLDLQQRFKALTEGSAPSEGRSFETVEECLRSSLYTQLMYCHWATEDWRWYIKWLEQATDETCIMAVYGPSGSEYSHKQYTPQDIQDLQIWGEAAAQVIVALQGNVDVMSALVGFYNRLMRNKSFPARDACADEVVAFATKVKNIIVEFRMQIKRAESLVKNISDRRELVVQHLQSQSAYRMERLSRKMEQEQIIMLIITVLTLIYLPATFVSTFFSTDIIKYQNTEGPDGSYSDIAMLRWVQVTLPLTFVTAALAWCGRRWMQRRSAREEQEQYEYERRHWTSGSQNPLKKAKMLFSDPLPLLPLHYKQSST